MTQVWQGCLATALRGGRRAAQQLDARREHRPKGWTYVDWTKGGNGPWSDVWERHDEKVVVAAIIRA